MRPVFNNTENERILFLDGYLVVDLLGSEEFQRVHGHLLKLGYGKVDGTTNFRISVTQDSEARRNEIFEGCGPVFQRALDRILMDYRVVRVAIFDKLPGGHDIRVHQHAALVDESKFRSLTVWVPLTETTREMGTLYVVKGSHRLSNHIRSYDDYYHAFSAVSQKVIRKYSTPLLLKPGQAVVFDDRLIHWSPRNKSSSIRTAVQLELVPRESDLTICYRDNEQELSRYAIDVASYRVSALTMDRPVNLELLGKLKQPNVRFSSKQFVTMMREKIGVEPCKKEVFFKRLFTR